VRVVTPPVAGGGGRGGWGGRGGGRGGGGGGGGGDFRPNRLLRCTPCARVLSLPRNGNLEPHPDASCPLCKYQVLQVQTGAGYNGKGYNVCPYCFSNPPRAHAPSADMASMPCFKCANAACALSGGSAGGGGGGGGGGAALYACGERGCRDGQVRLRQLHGGKPEEKWVLGCDKWRDGCKGGTLWLPRAVLAAAVAADAPPCARCSGGRAGDVRKLDVKLKPGSMPPGAQMSFRTCVKCEDKVQQLDRAHHGSLSSNQQQQQQRQPGGGAARQPLAARR